MVHSKMGTKIVCPNDGSTNVRWDIGRGKMRCEACRHEFEVVAPAVVDGESMFNGIMVDGKIAADLAVPEEIAEYACKGCGAKVILDKRTSMGARCSWCRNELVMDKVIGTEFTPNGIVPFGITREKALGAFRKWVKKRWFVRRDFGSQDADIEVKAIYYPFYVVDRSLEHVEKATGSTSSSYRSGNYIVTNYKDYALSAPVKMLVDDYEAVALGEVKNKLIVNQVQPWDWKLVRSFDYAYLNAFAAEHRDITLVSAQEEINRELEVTIKMSLNRAFSRAANLGSVDVGELDGVHRDEVAYCLAPVWLITYVDRKGGKIYYFAMNGQTGKVSGILPISWQKLVLFLAGLTLISAGVTALVNVLYLVAVSRGGV